MTRPLPLLPFLLLTLLTIQLPDAAAQKPEQSRPAPTARGPMRLVVQLGHHDFQYGFAAFSSDGRLVATGSSGDVVLWDVASGREVKRFSGNEGDPGAQDVDGWLWGAFSPDGRLFAA